jgi:hypothetical protein
MGVRRYRDSNDKVVQHVNYRRRSEVLGYQACRGVGEMCQLKRREDPERSFLFTFGNLFSADM